MDYRCDSWPLIGGILLILGGILRRHSPISAVFIGVCWIAQLIGFLGALIRVPGTSDLAIVYAFANPDQQLTILNSCTDLYRLINSHYHVAVLFSGVGYLLAAVSFFSLKGFPRWIAAGMAIPGLLGLVQFVIVALGLPFYRPLNFIGIGL